ncbi:stage V sporulation protein B [Thermodesulfitimonas autotrophica]|uniref:stage V sporulation protein B n=1 Tax=Thermodesulfitimonas autotrophica TaxID=1894989 RepID=UPI002FE1533C
MRQSLLTGTLVLTGASLVNRVLGFVYQVFLIRLIRAEGIGLFTMVYPLYVLALVIASLGIPVAIAKLVADAVTKRDFGAVGRLLRLSLACTVVASLLVTVTAIATAKVLTGKIVSNPATYLPFVSLLPGVFIVSVCSVFRGFFQGLQYMTPTATSQMLEQLVRVVAGLTLASILLPYGVVAAACGASLGVVCGEGAGFLLMLGYFFRSRDLVAAGRRGPFFDLALGRELFALALPVTLMRLVSTGFLALEAVLIPHRLLATGLTTREATSIYGQFAGIAETLLYTPGIITVSLATALVPAIAEALAARRGDLLSSRVNNALRLTVLTGLPSAAVLFLLPGELCHFIFGYREAGAILQVLAFGAPFLYLQQTTTGILQGLGRPLVPFRNLVVASIFKLTGIYFLTGLPEYGIRGAAAAVVVGFAVMSLLNLVDLWQLTGCTPTVGEVILKPLVATLPATVVLKWGSTFFTSRGAGPLLSLTAELLLAGTVYVAGLILTGALRRDDCARLFFIFGKIFAAIKR